MNEHPTTQKIARLIRARYPVIAVNSHEEARVADHLIEAAKGLGFTLTTWTITRGLTQVHPEPDVPSDGYQWADPVAALQHVIEMGAPTDREPNGPRALFVFKDLHPWLSGEQSDKVVIRALRDAAAQLSRRHQSVILLQPGLEIPADLEKDVAVVDFPLPTAEELWEQVSRFIDNLPDGVDCDLNGGREQVVRALQGLTTVEADAVLAQAVIEQRRLGLDAIPYILEQKAEIIRKSGALEYFPEQASHDDIGELDLLKAWCRESELAFTDAAAGFGVEPDKGLLIVGVPGCGKSLTAKAAGGGTRPLLRLDVGALFGGLVGQSEAQTRNALKVAEAVAPCVLWIDEIEKALGSAGGELDGGTNNRVLMTILTWMQESKAPVFVVATANDIGQLRPELIRRFSEVFFVDLPTEKGRAEILSIHLQKRGRDHQAFDVARVAAETAEFTGSEMEKVVQAGLRRAFARGEELTTEHLVEVARTMVPLATTMSGGIAQMREWAARARPASSRQQTGRKVGSGGRALMM